MGMGKGQVQGGYVVGMGMHQQPRHAVWGWGWHLADKWSTGRAQGHMLGHVTHLIMQQHPSLIAPGGGGGGTASARPVAVVVGLAAVFVSRPRQNSDAALARGARWCGGSDVCGAGKHTEPQVDAAHCCTCTSWWLVPGSLASGSAVAEIALPCFVEATGAGGRALDRRHTCSAVAVVLLPKTAMTRSVVMMQPWTLQHHHL